MKKFIILLFIVISGQAFAQFTVGLKTGISMSNFKVKTQFKDAAKIGFAGGVTVGNTIGKNLMLQADFLYVQKGYNHQICNQCYDRLTTVFVEIPVSLRYTLNLVTISPKLDNFKVNFNGGLYFSQWLNAQYETKIFADKVKQDYTFSGEKRLDFGPNFGLGLEYHLFAGSLHVDYRASLGMVDMSAPGSTSASKNSSGIISLSYLKSF